MSVENPRGSLAGRGGNEVQRMRGGVRKEDVDIARAGTLRDVAGER
jgi:hypothetical protein